MVDLNQWWRMAGDIFPALDVAAVRPVAAELAELGVTWLEEPLPAADPAGMRLLREQCGIRAAGGEMARSVPELLDAIDAGALDVIQPDVVVAVGMLRARTVAEISLQRGRWFTPHTWTNGLGLLANLHVAAGVGGLAWARRSTKTPSRAGRWMSRKSRGPASWPALPPGQHCHLASAGHLASTGRGGCG